MSSASPADLDPTDLAERFEAKGFCDGDTPELRDALDELGRKCRALRSQANAYAADSIPADVRDPGAALVGLARTVASRLNKAGLTELEVVARHGAASAVCSVMAHDDHEVATTMVDLGLCLERSGDEERAQSVLRAVASDYARVLDELSSEPPSAEQMATLNALATALERLTDRSADDEAILTRTRSVLAT